MYINVKINRANYRRTVNYRRYTYTPQHAAGAQHVTIIESAALICGRTLSIISPKTPQVLENVVLKGVMKCMVVPIL
jgi:hypothetical protein